MLLSNLLISCAALATSSLAAALPTKRQDDAKVGYFFVSFPVWDEAIYFSLSNGNDPHSYTRLCLDCTNATEAILRSNVGTKGVRDAHIVPSRDGTNFFMTATDLQVNSFTGDFNEATRFGSRSIVIWESPNLADWTQGRLSAPIVNASAGNVWAPETVWDPERETYVMVFASRFWSPSDPRRTGRQPPNVLMYVTTDDFVTFSQAETYFWPGFPVIDTTFYHAVEEGPNVWYRLVKSEVDYMIWQQRSETGLFGTWTNVGGAPDGQRIEFARGFSNNEGGLIFRDNIDPGRYHLWIDQSSTEQYIPAEARTLNDMAAWQRVPLQGFPTSVKHGVVVPVTQGQYDGILSRYRRKE
ncbi:hypothetical protein CAC42_6863 [Sphaceloma murrayae]|uniref:Uncharacterized protein n=1 Tax=Sphaceloma murrayae TaxID=2082308 RepID=A0A2K1QHG4_9PEZI|nr:hypothetical protein CAC42_6863 [Sphaceloma murrayae]